MIQADIWPAYVFGNRSLEFVNFSISYKLKKIFSQHANCNFLFVILTCFFYVKYSTVRINDDIFFEIKIFNKKINFFSGKTFLVSIFFKLEEIFNPDSIWRFHFTFFGSFSKGLRVVRSGAESFWRKVSIQPITTPFF